MEDKISLKQASEKLSIKYSSAKTIIQTFKVHGRIMKKLTRDKKKRRSVIPGPLNQARATPSPLSMQQAAAPIYTPLTKPEHMALAELPRLQASCHISWQPSATFIFHDYAEQILSSFYERRVKRTPRFMQQSVLSRVLPWPKGVAK